MDMLKSFARLGTLKSGVGCGAWWPLRAGSWCAIHMAVGQHQWYHFGVGAPLILVYFRGDWDVHWGYGVLTHGHVAGKSNTSKD